MTALVSQFLDMAEWHKTMVMKPKRNGFPSSIETNISHLGPNSPFFFWATGLPL